MHTPELVLLGGPNSGKTHYAGQLYGRLCHRPGVLSLRTDQGTPPDLSALEEVLHALNNGHAAGHTPHGTSVEVLLPLVDEQGRALDLHWPDYGGEQLRAVFEERGVKEEWRQRLVKAEGWVLLIRLQSETTFPDALEDLVKRGNGNGNCESTRKSGWDANAYWVELLQLLLHVSGHGTVQRLHRPRLTVLLSCYDEMGASEVTPAQRLAEKLPLLSAFIGSVWATEAVSVWGLSALGRPLDKEGSNDAFVNEGPEHQGWVIPPAGGAQDPDLTKPLAWLLEAL